VLRYADQIIATTQASATELEEHVRRIQRTTPVACIYNGFDPRDFEELLPPARVHGVSEEHPFDLVYTGTLWGLTNVEPLVQAVQLVNAQNPEIASMIRLQLVGRRTPEQEAHLETLESTSIRLVRTEYLPHRQSLALARRADMLLLLLSATAGAERVVPAKMFEYMACHRAILGILPPGEAKSILQACPNAMVLAPNDPRRIADFLVKRINEMRAPESADQSPKRPPMLASSPSLEESTSQGAWSDSWTAFDRRGQARQLANLLAACHKNRH
jgi:glycosyltransferase involved in cell wall biosynthesis